MLIKNQWKWLSIILLSVVVSAGWRRLPALDTPQETQPASEVEFLITDEKPIRKEEHVADANRPTGRLGSRPTSADFLDQLKLEWSDARLVFVVTGRQHGYIEPCGCTGLENAKGGLSRRHTLLRQLRATGWKTVPLDVGNQIRRFGKQAEIKFQRTAELLNKMKYAAVGLGPDDLRLSLDGLLAPLSEGRFVCANVDIFDLNRSHFVIQSGGKKIGITAVVGSEVMKKVNRGQSDIAFTDPATALTQVLPKLAGVDIRVLLAQTSLAETRALVRRFPQVFDLVVTAGGAGEPTLEPESLPGCKSKIVQVGTKGMYVGLVGIFDDPTQPIRYERVVLDDRFPDSELVMETFADYQKQLKLHGLEGLGIRPVKHPSGHTFVGYETCGECHTSALEVFESTPHHHATESLVHPPNSRGSIPRHFDPECISCHVTGWNPQEYFPYTSGYLSLEDSWLHANGCENCHGPGSQHVAVEMGDLDVSEEERLALREQMRITLEEARTSGCYTCHDLDNSPGFEFDSYWEQVKHYGKD